MRDLKKYIWVAIYLICVIYITILSRASSLVRIAKTIPFWSFSDWIRGNRTIGISIVLNIGLFIPLGYFLADLLKTKWLPFLCGLILSVSIEVIQYVTYYGYFDIDDIISNLVGVCIGIAVRYLVEKSFAKWRKWVPVVLITTGFIGCLIASKNVQYYETQFDFDIGIVQVDEGRISISGVCDIYNRDSLDFSILLKSKNGTQKANTQIDGNTFSASIDTSDHEYEVLVQFSGHRPISTKTYINNSKVEYVSNAPAPEIEDTDLAPIIRSGALKAYEPEYDLYVYQVKNRLYWLIGKDYDANLIYHLHTNEPEKLPEDRKQYGFDNRSIPIESKKELTNSINCGKYLVFTDIIPSEYYVTAVMVGMNKGASILWRQYFRPNRF